VESAEENQINGEIESAAEKMKRQKLGGIARNQSNMVIKMNDNDFTR
jgi:hypothetical protein